jgi:hypothetical protein
MGVKPKPSGGMVLFERVSCRLRWSEVSVSLLFSLTVETVLRGLSDYLKHVMGGHVLAPALFLIFDLAVVVLLFAIIFSVLTRCEVSMARRVGDRSSFCLGKVRSWPLPWQRSGRLRTPRKTREHRQPAYGAIVQPVRVKHRSLIHPCSESCRNACSSESHRQSRKLPPYRFQRKRSPLSATVKAAFSRTARTSFCRAFLVELLVNRNEAVKVEIMEKVVTN